MRAVLARSTEAERFSPDAKITGEGVRVSAVIDGERVEVGTVMALRVEEGDLVGEIDLDDSGAGVRVGAMLRLDEYALATQVTGTNDDGDPIGLTTLDPKPSEA